MTQSAMALARATIRSSSSPERVMALTVPTGSARSGPISQTWNCSAIPKWLSTVFPSLLVKATRMASSVVRELLRGRGVRLQQVRHLEDELRGPLVADPHLVVRAEPVEHRQPRAQVRPDAELRRRLPRVRVGDDEIDPGRGWLQIL